MISPALEEGGVDESGRGVASAVKDYACCGSEDDLDQGLDFERGEAASAVEVEALVEILSLIHI